MFTNLCRAFAFTFVVALGLMAVAAEPTTPKERLVGTWAELPPDDHLVYFGKDGVWKIYLTKGTLGERRSLDGTWSLDGENTLTVLVNLGEVTRTLKSKLSFEGEEMILSALADDNSNNGTSKHRRHTGPIPERFKW